MTSARSKQARESEIGRGRGRVGKKVDLGFWGLLSWLLLLLRLRLLRKREKQLLRGRGQERPPQPAQKGRIASSQQPAERQPLRTAATNESGLCCPLGFFVILFK